MPAKLITYDSQNYAGTLGSGLNGRNIAMNNTASKAYAANVFLKTTQLMF